MSNEKFLFVSIMALRKKLFIGFILTVALICIHVFFILPAVIKPIAAEKLAAILNRQVNIEKIIINPYALSVAVLGHKISEPAPSTNLFIAFDELYVNLYGISSLFQ